MTEHLLYRYLLLALLAGPSPITLLAGDAAVPVYEVVTLHAYIEQTLSTSYQETVKVVGSPRIYKGHPCTLWDQEDVDRLKSVISTETALQERLSRLRTDMVEKRIGPAAVERDPATQTISIHLKAGAKTEFAAKR